ncbi:hypothetical protein [Roseomonas chloroacetimidivorans]|uniref:hypothetical protein n=1 Tax=Roseomonas chloroacetimidivorans TaxID=1766656 RepID=UPI003C71EA04
MTRTEVRAQYCPIRAGIRRVLREAAETCRRADLNGAVKQVAPWAEAEALEDAGSAEMLVDVALFEPNQRGRRAFDRGVAILTAGDADLITGSTLSINGGQHMF